MPSEMTNVALLHSLYIMDNGINTVKNNDF